MRKFVIVIYFLLNPIIMLVIKIDYFLRKTTITFFNQISHFIILVCSIRIILTIIRKTIDTFYISSFFVILICYIIL